MKTLIFLALAMGLSSELTRERIDEVFKDRFPLKYECYEGQIPLEKNTDLISLNGWYLIKPSFKKGDPDRIILVRDLKNEWGKEGAEKDAEFWKEHVGMPVIAPIEVIIDKEIMMVSILDKKCHAGGYSMKIFSDKSETFLSQLKGLVTMVLSFHSKKLTMPGIDLDSMLVCLDIDKDSFDFYIFHTVSIMKKGNPTYNAGSYRYYDPNKLTTNSIPNVADFADDAYMIGVSLYYRLSNGSYPFTGSTEDEYAKNANKGDYVIKTKVDPNLVLLVVLLLQHDREARLDLNILQSYINELPVIKNEGLEYEIKVNSKTGVPEELAKRVKPELLKELYKPPKGVQSIGETGVVSPQSLAKDISFSPMNWKGWLVVIVSVIIGLAVAVSVFICCRKQETTGEGENKDLTAELPVDPSVKVQ